MVLLKKSTGRLLPSALLLALMGSSIVAIWLRNRDVLGDLYDYSIVVAAAGKIEAGLKPYSGVRSPLQSSIYLLNYGAEWLFGRNYLGLTLGGLVQALGGALLVWGMLRPPLGRMAATLVALAVSLAGLLQHTVFFYNPVGILCLSVVLLGLAVEPALGPVWSWRTVAISGALFLGGINKLNFQGATLVCAGLLSWAAWTGGRLTARAVVRNLLLLALFGCLLPLGFELAWTKATFAQWLDNVVLLPTERHAYFQLALDPGIYLRPVHDFYHPVPIRAIGGLGLLLLLLTGGWLLDDARAKGLPPSAWIVRLLLIIAGSGLGALLMVTNHETVMLTSLAYPVMALALYLHFRGSGRLIERWMERIILGAMAVWAAAGGYAAWHGSRVLYTPEPPAWTSYVRIHAATGALAYFDGVKMPPAQIAAMVQTAARLKTMESRAGRLDGVLFGPGLEWMERAYPESITRHAPIGFVNGITLHEDDRDYLKDLCLRHGEWRLVVQNGWQNWPASIWRMLADDYRREIVGSRDLIYHPRGSRPPAVEAAPPDSLPPGVFRDRAVSNVLITSTRFSKGMGLLDGPGGAVFGANHSTNWLWPLGANDVQGWAVAQLGPGRSRAGVVTFRALAGDPDTGAIWETSVTVDSGQGEVAVPFALQPGGRPVWLQTVIRDADRGALVGGWRGLRITHSNESDQSPALPFAAGLVRVLPGPEEPVADTLWYARDPGALSPEEWVRVPAENWRRAEMRPGTVRVQVEFTPDQEAPADPVVLTLAWYRAGRFEIMTERVIDLQTTRRVTLEAVVTEPGGWIGLLARGGEAKNHRLRVMTWGKLPLP